MSFDIDNLLIPYSNEFEVYELNFSLKLLGVEGIRKGTKELFEHLQKEQHEIWIYTTSYRSITSLKKTFRLQGLKPQRYINEKINRKYLNAKNCKASKNPKLFNIDIHIDDSKGVEQEGQKYGFQTIIIDPLDTNWVQTVMYRIREVEKGKK